MASEELIEKEANERYPDRPVVLGRGNTCLSCGEVQRDAFKAGAEWCMNELLKKWGNSLEDLNNEIDEIGIVGVLKKYSVFKDNNNMAKFKVNDLITDGNVTMWITGVTDTHYIFTEQSFDKFSRPIESIDANFRLYEPKKIWHTPNDKPDEDEEILYEWDSNDATWHNVAFFHKDTKNFTLDHKHQKYLNEVTKWAYIKDLV